MVTLYQPGLFDSVPTLIYRPQRPRPRRDRVCVGRFLHLGAGLQSSTLAEMLVTGDLPRVDAVLFADTGNEPPWVYEQVAYLTRRLLPVGIPLVILRKSAGGLQADCRAPGGRFATMPLYTRDPITGQIGRMRRQCTNDYKVQPLHHWVLDWLVARGHARVVTARTGVRSRRVRRDVYVEQVLGISLDEFERSGRHRGPQWQHARYPLIERRLRRADCAAWLAAHGLPIPRKSSCLVCPFHDDAYWRHLQCEYPDLFEAACQFDDWLRTPEGRRKLTRKRDQPAYLHRTCVPLRMLDLAARRALPLFEQAAVCGDFNLT
jgi:hypothetical protein